MDPELPYDEIKALRDILEWRKRNGESLGRLPQLIRRLEAEKKAEVNG